MDELLERKIIIVRGAGAVLFIVGASIMTQIGVVNALGGKMHECGVACDILLSGVIVLCFLFGIVMCFAPPEMLEEKVKKL